MQLEESYQGKIAGCSVFTGKNIEIGIDKGKISSVKEFETSENLPFISPGFMDTQLNGYAGFDYNTEELCPSDILELIKILAAAGTSRHFPTIITNTKELILKNLNTISKTITDNPEISGAIPGIHIEGPYISYDDGPRGAHNIDFVREPDFNEFLEWQDAAEGRIRQITLAPERTGALNYIKKVSDRGVVVSIGHTAAEPDIIRKAVQAGAIMSTHLGNGSHGTIPRLKNYLWEQMASDKLSASIIADGFHLPPAVVKVILRAKTDNKVILVSDAAVLGGMEQGIHKWGSINVEVYSDGHLGLVGTEYLAGSGHLLDTSIAWIMNKLERSPGEAVRLCTVNPQKLFFPTASVPELKPEDPADITLFNWKEGDQKIKVLTTLLQGRIVYSQPL